MNEEEYLIERLQNQIDWYGKKSQYNQKRYKGLRLIEIISASLIPFLAGIVKDIPNLEWLIGGLGVVIAIAAGASSLFKFQENWIQYRTTAETLKHEKFLYLTKAFPYNDQNAFTQLVERVENIISQENTQWVSSTKQRSQKEKQPKSS